MICFTFFLSRSYDSELYDEEEELTCNFCERSFNSVRRLEQHQQRKRHYMCSICDTVFDGLMLLEMHKETLDHWSDYELRVKKAQEESDYSEEELEEHRIYSNRSGDELRRLLL
ncbi:c2H2-type domain-containing protein [Trichonephila inaurata madagascariensis]|uniref:C2H2-type domain-containing protein n=1 Tax=Trichonephila inaurata madagascariensis TaxID=2747483 RepID=A0A8X6WR92_9ARAC|nr:c2H2-type domain-containing protein [Trichonephila inaurata madagascariensis]